MAKGGDQVGAWYSLGSRGRGRRGLNARFRASKLNESSRAEGTLALYFVLHFYVCALMLQFGTIRTAEEGNLKKNHIKLERVSE
jgi:hypothetical protein